MSVYFCVEELLFAAQKMGKKESERQLFIKVDEIKFMDFLLTDVHEKLLEVTVEAVNQSKLGIERWAWARENQACQASQYKVTLQEIDDEWRNEEEM